MYKRVQRKNTLPSLQEKQKTLLADDLAKIGKINEIQMKFNGVEVTIPQRYLSQ